MEDDWDLHAVVRGCAALTTTTATVTSSSTAAAAAATATATTSQVFSNFQQDFNFTNSCFQDLFEPRRERLFEEELHDVYKPLFPKNQDSSQLLFSLPISPLSVLGDLPSEQHRQQTTQLRRKPPSFSVSDVSKPHNPTPRSKRRKNHLKRVCHVAAENISSDMWSWRKYGQKPIKGSPYPRGYYRCSTSKGCMARKQVERNRSDPGMFIVTYTSEHNHPMPTHRNSLAGSTRQKPAETLTSDDPGKPFSSPEKLESSREDLADAEDDDDEFSVSKMALDDDFFVGLEDFTAPDAGDVTSGHIPVNLPFPWLSNSATTAAGGG